MLTLRKSCAHVMVPIFAAFVIRVSARGKWTIMRTQKIGIAGMGKFWRKKDNAKSYPCPICSMQPTSLSPPWQQSTQRQNPCDYMDQMLEAFWPEVIPLYPALSFSTPHSQTSPAQVFLNYIIGHNYNGHYLHAGGLSVNNYVRENKVREVNVRE